jgi:hypothetical protein
MTAPPEHSGGPQPRHAGGAGQSCTRRGRADAAATNDGAAEAEFDPHAYGPVLASLDTGKKIFADALNTALEIVVTTHSASAGFVKLHWYDKSMRMQAGGFQMPDGDRIFVPIYYAHHYALLVADRAQGVLGVYDSMPDYQVEQRNRIAEQVQRVLKLPGLQVLQCDRQGAASNDCALHVLRNAARCLGGRDWELTRDDVKAMLRAHWGVADGNGATHHHAHDDGAHQGSVVEQRSDTGTATPQAVAGTSLSRFASCPAVEEAPAVNDSPQATKEAEKLRGFSHDASRQRIGDVATAAQDAVAAHAFGEPEARPPAGAARGSFNHDASL